MTFFTVAGIQMPVSSKTENLTAMGQQLDALMARFPHVQMVVFSELCAYGPDRIMAQPIGSSAEAAFREMAKRHSIWLIPGSFYERDGNSLFNTSLVINPQGSIVERYRKIFPFQPYETDVMPGKHFCVFEVPDVGRFGVSICYDKWFPETTRTLAVMGAEVILHPTMTDTIDRDIELSITRTTAALNQCYFFDVNGLGDGGSGRSLVVGPCGEVIHQAGNGSEVFPIEIDLQRVRRERERGLLGLGQPLKSFRDRNVDFAAAQSTDEVRAYLAGLGGIRKPVRGASRSSGSTIS